MSDDPCGAIEEMSGAVCSLHVGHDLMHKDESDLGCVITFRDCAKLIVPDFGTELEVLERFL